jgi:hypothetical protein
MRAEGILLYRKYGKIQPGIILNPDIIALLRFEKSLLELWNISHSYG